MAERTRLIASAANANPGAAPPPPVPAELSTATLAQKCVLTLFFDVKWDPISSLHQIACICRNTGPGHPVIVKALVKKTNTPKAGNICSHFVNNHNRSFTADFWRATSHPTDRPAVTAVIQLAATSHDPWSLKHLGEWYNAMSERDAAPFDTWLTRVAQAYRAYQPEASMSQSRIPVASSTYYQLSIEQCASSLDTPKGRNKVFTAICMAIMCAKDGVPFRLADSAALELLLGKTRRQLPNRKHVRALIEVLHAVVIDQLEANLRRASSFSILFDIWSSRSMNSSFLAVVYTYIDESFKYSEALLDVIPLRDRRHTGDTLALEVVRRIELHTTKTQFFFGSTTDNAPNVKLAAVQAINCYENLLERVQSGALETASLRIWVRPGGPRGDERDNSDAQELIERDLRHLQVEEDSFLPDRGDQRDVALRLAPVPVLAEAASDEPDPDGAVAAAEDNEDDPISDLDRNRAHQCYLHDLNLCVLYAIAAVDDFRQLLGYVDRIVAAVSKSTLMQNMLKKAQRALKMKVLKLIKRCPTRWNSVNLALVRYGECHPALLVMCSNGAFVDCASYVHMPTDDEAVAIAGIAAALEPLRHLTKLLETTDNCIAYLPLFTVELLAKLEHVGTSPQVVNELRQSLRLQVDKRLGKHYKDPSQPSVLAAMLHPATSSHLLAAFSDWLVGGRAEAKKVLKAGKANLIQWIIEVFGQVEEDTIDTLPKRARFDDSDDESQRSADSQSSPVAAPPVADDQRSRADAAARRRAEVDASLSAILGELDHSAGCARVQWSAESMALAASSLCQFYTQPKNSTLVADIARVKPLVRLLMSLSPVSASAERAFSCSGRINSPMRNRLGEDVIEGLTVIQYYLATVKPDLKQLAARVLMVLDRMH